MFTKVASILKTSNFPPTRIGRTIQDKLVDEFMSMFEKDNPKNFDKKKFLNIAYEGDVNRYEKG